MALAIGAALPSCAQKDQSNKEERNAIRSGNKNFDEKKYAESGKTPDSGSTASQSPVCLSGIFRQQTIQ